MVAVQPTRGLDVGAIEAVHRLLLDQREAGAAILLISEELDEMLALTDRIAVIYEGRVLGTFERAEADIAGDRAADDRRQRRVPLTRAPSPMGPTRDRREPRGPADDRTPRGPGTRRALRAFELRLTAPRGPALAAAGWRPSARSPSRW